MIHTPLRLGVSDGATRRQLGKKHVMKPFALLEPLVQV